MQNFLCAGLVERNVEPMENQFQKRLVHSLVRNHNGDIPIAAAALHQLRNPLRGSKALYIGSLCVGYPKIFGVMNGTLKQSFLHRIQIPGNVLNLHFHPGPLGTAQKLPGSLSGFFKCQEMGAGRITVQAYGDAGRNPDEMFQNFQILPGKVRKTIYVKGVVFSEIPQFQLFQQPGHPISGVPLSPGTEAVVGRHQKGQFFQLLGQAPFRLFGSVFQVLGRDAAAFEFVHRIDKAREKFRSRLHSGIGFQAAGKLTGRGCHGDHPAAFVQALPGGKAHGVRHPAIETGKGQDLGITAGSVSGASTETALRIVADELRHHEYPVSLTIFYILRNAF